MILAALASLYERTVGTEGGPPPLGYTEVPVVGALNIGPAGELNGLLDLRQETAVGKKTKRLPARRVVPQPPVRTMNTASGFLCDHAGYLLGYDAKGNAKRAAEQFGKARELHELVLAEIDDPTAARILAYFWTWEPSKAAAVLVHEPQEMATRPLLLRDAESGRFFHEVPPIRAAWERYVAAKDAPRGQCLITGHEN
jgi:CRISPR-associated protein Csd1